MEKIKQKRHYGQNYFASCQITTNSKEYLMKPECSQKLTLESQGMKQEKISK